MQEESDAASSDEDTMFQNPSKRKDGAEDGKKPAIAKMSGPKQGKLHQHFYKSEARNGFSALASTQAEDEGEKQESEDEGFMNSSDHAQKEEQGEDYEGGGEEEDEKEDEEEEGEANGATEAENGAEEEYEDDGSGIYPNMNVASSSVSKVSLREDERGSRMASGSTGIGNAALPSGRVADAEAGSRDGSCAVDIPWIDSVSLVARHAHAKDAGHGYVVVPKRSVKYALPGSIRVCEGDEAFTPLQIPAEDYFHNNLGTWKSATTNLFDANSAIWTRNLILCTLPQDSEGASNEERNFYCVPVRIEPPNPSAAQKEDQKKWVEDGYKFLMENATPKTVHLFILFLGGPLQKKVVDEPLKLRNGRFKDVPSFLFTERADTEVVYKINFFYEIKANLQSPDESSEQASGFEFEGWYVAVQNKKAKAGEKSKRKVAAQADVAADPSKRAKTFLIGNGRPQKTASAIQNEGFQNGHVGSGPVSAPAAEAQSSPLPEDAEDPTFAPAPAPAPASSTALSLPFNMYEYTNVCRPEDEVQIARNVTMTRKYSNVIDPSKDGVHLDPPLFEGHLPSRCEIEVKWHFDL